MSQIQSFYLFEPRVGHPNATDDLLCVLTKTSDRTVRLTAIYSAIISLCGVTRDPLSGTYICDEFEVDSTITEEDPDAVHTCNISGAPSYRESEKSRFARLSAVECAFIFAVVFAHDTTGLRFGRLELERHLHSVEKLRPRIVHHSLIISTCLLCCSVRLVGDRYHDAENSITWFLLIANQRSRKDVLDFLRFGLAIIDQSSL